MIMLPLKNLITKKYAKRKLRKTIYMSLKTQKLIIDDQLLSCR